MSHLYWHVLRGFVQLLVVLRDRVRFRGYSSPTVYYFTFLLPSLFFLLHVLSLLCSSSSHSFCSCLVVLSLILVVLYTSFLLLYHLFMLFSFVSFSFLRSDLKFSACPYFPPSTILVPPFQNFVLYSFCFKYFLIMFFAFYFDFHLSFVSVPAIFQFPFVLSCLRYFLSRLPFTFSLSQSVSAYINFLHFEVYALCEIK